MDELKLSEAQSAELKALIKEAQSQQTDAQFERKGASQALLAAVQDPQKPEAEVLKLADALMQIEAKQKRARLQTALKVRALLSPEQRQQVMDLKGKLRDRIKERRAQKRARRGKKGRRDRSSEWP
jgi:Spy/CpxP family protein refolding chaperone